MRHRDRLRTVMVAFPVAKLTLAATPPIPVSFFSTRAAHAAHVIPSIDSSTWIGASGVAGPATRADDIRTYLSARPLTRPGRHWRLIAAMGIYTYLLAAAMRWGLR
jgi:hypothetical protein